MPGISRSAFSSRLGPQRGFGLLASKGLLAFLLLSAWTPARASAQRDAACPHAARAVHAAPAVRASSLEELVSSADNLLVARLLGVSPRAARLSYKGHRGAYSTADLHLEVKAVFLGGAVTGERFHAAYLKPVESAKHGFKPGRDYLLAFRETEPYFLDVTPWDQSDGAFAVRGGYSPGAPVLDLVSAFWVGFPGRKIGWEEFNRLVQARLKVLKKEVLEPLQPGN